MRASRGMCLGLLDEGLRFLGLSQRGAFKMKEYKDLPLLKVIWDNIPTKIFRKLVRFGVGE